MKNDRVDAFDRDAFIEAIRAGKLYGTTGPILEVALTDGHGQRAEIGDRFKGSHGELELTVRAAPWVPISKARIYVNAERVENLDISADQPISISLTFDRDAFVTVEVEGPADARYLEIAPDFKPFAFTNPIFVDADGDGEWTAPGLPAIPPHSIRDPLGGV
jgi:hypothetical protein